MKSPSNQADDGPSPTALLHLRTLGSVEIDGDGGALAGRSKLLVLLAYLAGEQGRPVPRERLAALLWGDSPETRARASLREALSRLRRALGDAIEADRATVRVVPDRLITDARAFEEAVREGQLGRAAELHGGPFLAGTEPGGNELFRAWLDGERERLRQLYRDVLRRLTHEAESRAEWQEAVSWAERWVAEAPLSDDAHRSLFRVLTLAGRAPEAAAVWTTFQATSRRELGVDPGPQPAPRETNPPAQALQRRLGSAAIFAPDLVGRERVFRRLVAAWETVERGGAEALLLRGAPGMGRTRLLREFRAWLETRPEPALVLDAAGQPADRADPDAHARRLLAPLRSARGLSGAGDGALAELATLVPEIRERFPQLPPARPDEAGALADGIRRVLEDVADEAPVLLCIDDLHHLDDRSLALLLALARHRPGRTLLLATSATGPEAERELGPGWRDAFETVPLPPLSAADLEALVASMVETPPADRVTLARAVHHASGGNPFIAAEQLATLVDEGHLRAGEDGVWRLDGGLDPHQLPIPTTVADAIRRRIARLPRPLQETLSIAALLWPEHDPELVAALAGTSQKVAGERLDTLLARRFLRPAPGRRWGYTFTHDLLRRVAYETIPTHRRSRLHATAARVLRQRGRDTDRVREAVRRHRERAGERMLRRSARRRLRRVALSGLTLAATGALLGMWGRGRAPEGRHDTAPIIAVGGIDAAAPLDADSAGAALRDVLGTRLAQLPGIRVVGQSRLAELIQIAELETGAPSCPSAAARRAGADQLLEGSLQRARDGRWRLDLRRVDLATGVVRGAHVLEAATLPEVARNAAARIALDLGIEVPPPGAEDGTRPRSPAAYALYEEGLRAYYRGDLLPARDRFEAALEEDPAFAMAAYYAARAAWYPDTDAGLRHLQRARQLSEHGSDRERLLIRGAWADLLDEPAVVAYAESLMARFPEEPMGYHLRGRSLVKAGAFMDAAPYFRHVLEMGAIAPGPRSVPGQGADAAADLATAYANADSLPAAERVIRAWVDRTPGSAMAWVRLRDVLEHQGRFDEALEAAAVARRLHDVPTAYDTNYPALIDLKRERFARADSAFARMIRDGSHDEARQALWFRIISRRWQGRLDDALDDALRFRGSGHTVPNDDLPPYDALAHAQTLFEVGQFRHSAALFDSLAITFSTEASEGHSAHQRTWMLTHSADALAAAGDTAALSVLADSLQRLGRRSSHGRDWILHHHVRGLLALARDDLPTAERELRQAVFSTRAGFTRTNYLLGTVLLERGAPLEAVAILQPIFRAPVDVSNFYLDRTRARALLGRAWLEAGRPDSALHHLRLARRAWAQADPPLDDARVRLDSLVARAEHLQRPPR